MSIITKKTLGELCYFGTSLIDSDSEEGVDGGIFDDAELSDSSEYGMFDGCSSDEGTLGCGLFDGGYSRSTSCTVRWDDKTKVSKDTPVIYFGFCNFNILSYSDTIQSNFPDGISRQILRVKNPDELNTNYLYHYMKSHIDILPAPSEHLIKLKAFEIPIPSMESQNTIVELETQLREKRAIEVDPNRAT